MAIGTNKIYLATKDDINSVINGTSTVAKATTATTLTGLTATTEELNYVDGVTSNIQTQLNSKATQDNLNIVDNKVDEHIVNEDIHFTAAERAKLSGIATGANKTIVDSSLSTSSTNPVQNQVITNWLADNVKNYRFAIDGSGTGTHLYLTSNDADVAASAPSGAAVIYTIDLPNDTAHIGALWENIILTPTTLSGYGITDAESKGTATSTVNTHNTSTSAHNDIRLLVSELTTKVTNFLNVNDTTKDQLSEIIALIDANADDIEKITSGKINVADIIDNLTTNIANKPLSASQGVAIKALIDALQGSLDTEIANRKSADTQSINTAKSYTDTSIANQATETWTFTFTDGTTSTKKVVVKQ